MASGTTTYTIELAAKMLGVDSASSQLESLEQQLLGAGNASAEAAEALALGERKYAQLEKAAVKAAQAFEKVKGKSRGFVDEGLKAEAEKAAAALRGEGAALDKLRGSATAAAAAHDRLKASFKATEKAARGEADALQDADARARGSGNIGKLKSALGDLGGPLGVVGQKAAGAADAVGNLIGALGTGPGALVAVAVAVVAAVALITVAIGAAIVKTAQWAVGLANAKRSAALNVEALEQTSASLIGLGKILPGVQRASGLTGDQIGDLARGLADAKVSAEDMPAALRAAALAEKALTGEGAKLIAEMKAGKRAVGELARKAESDFGDIVARKLLSLDDQTETLKRNLGETFGGLKIEGLLGEVKRLVALFDSTTASGKTMKVLFETLFQPLIDAVVVSGPLIERMFLGAAIAALKLLIAIKPGIKLVKQLLGEADDSALPDAFAVAEFAGRALVYALGTILVMLGLIAVGAALVAAPFILIGILAAAAFGRVYNEAASAIEFLQSISLTEIGTQMMQGLANGITAGKDKVVAAITGAARDAISAAKKLLGIASPSKVFEGLGVNVGEGFEAGVDDSSAGTQSALESMVAPPAAKGGVGGAGVGGPVTVYLTIHADTDKGEDIAHAVEGVLLRIWEGDVLQLGGQPPEGAPA
jgi:hypothetical protein